MITFKEASINRQTAIKNGDVLYQGRDCVNSHGGVRNTKTRRCCKCKNDYEKMNYEKMKWKKQK